MTTEQRILEFCSTLKRMSSHVIYLASFKIFKNTPNRIYGYIDPEAKDTYTTAENCPSIDLDFVDFFRQATKANPNIKFCELNDGSAYRFRFYSEDLCHEKRCEVIDGIKQDMFNHMCRPKVKVVSSEKGTEMNFSLTDLKDAVVEKVTRLDRKTVTILAIIALLLLIVGKYNTIKGIILGIRDKVRNSEDFKAMVTDGTNAINGLKKVVGIKDKGNK